MLRTLVLDLDGTLVDSAPDLQAALNRMMQERGLAPFAAPEVKAMIGDGAGVLVQRAFTARGLEAAADDIAAFVADYSAHAAVESRAFAGTREALEAAQAAGWRLAVCTNKPEAPARSLLAALDLLPFFHAIGGGDSFPSRKPDPAHLLATVQAAGGDAATSVMVGDHRNDVAAARGAGMASVFAGWGYGAPAMADGASAIAESWAEVLPIADRLLGAA